MPAKYSKVVNRVVIPLIVLIVAAILGSIRGSSRVSIVDTGIWQLETSYQSIYLQAVADAYALDNNDALAVERMAFYCQEDGSLTEAFNQAQERYGNDPDKAGNLASLRSLVDSGAVQPNEAVPVCDTRPVGSIGTIGLVSLVLLILIAVGFIAYGVFLVINVGEEQAMMTAASGKETGGASMGGALGRASTATSTTAPPAPTSSRAAPGPAKVSGTSGSRAAPAPPKEEEKSSGGGLFGFGRSSGSVSEDTATSAAARGAQISKTVEKTDFSETQVGPPLVQFMTTYLLGDDLYDDSFSIETPSGEFLGETGVGISETLSTGDASKKATAFEVWLFDKNDIRTVTKVVMSDFAFGNEELRAKLAPKGEAVKADGGSRFALETASLRIQARIVDVSYGSGGGTPPNSFMERITVELAAWRKNT